MLPCYKNPKRKSPQQGLGQLTNKYAAGVSNAGLKTPLEKRALPILQLLKSKIICFEILPLVSLLMSSC